ncbi:hypothetical protein LguiB_014807 [Lonicera macranthoides]
MSFESPNPNVNVCSSITISAKKNFAEPVSTPLSTAALLHSLRRAPTRRPPLRLSVQATYLASGDRRLTQTYFGGAGEEEGEEKWVEERECGEMLRPSLRSVLKSIALLFVFGT